MSSADCVRPQCELGHIAPEGGLDNPSPCGTLLRAKGEAEASRGKQEGSGDQLAEIHEQKPEDLLRVCNSHTAAPSDLRCPEVLWGQGSLPDVLFFHLDSDPGGLGRALT